MVRVSLFLGSFIALIACTGCNALRFFSIANDITGAIVNTSIIAGVTGLAFNIESIITYIQNLLGGI